MEKAKTLSRSVTQQQTVEQIVGFPPWRRWWSFCRKWKCSWWKRADERIDDAPVLTVLEKLVEKGILERIVEQIGDMSVPQQEEQLVKVPKAVFRDGIQQRVGEHIVERCHE